MQSKLNTWDILRLVNSRLFLDWCGSALCETNPVQCHGSKLPAIHHHSTRRSTWRLLPPTRLGDLFDWGLCHISIVSVVSVITLTRTGSGQFTRRIPSTVGLPGRFKQGPQKWSTDEASGKHGTFGLPASLYQSHKLLLLQIEGSVVEEPSNFWSNVHRYAPHHLQLPSTSSSALVKWLLQLASQAVSHTRTSAPMNPLGPSPVTRKLWKLLISKILVTEVYILRQRRNQWFWFWATWNMAIKYIQFIYNMQHLDHWKSPLLAFAFASFLAGSDVVSFVFFAPWSGWSAESSLHSRSSIGHVTIIVTSICSTWTWHSGIVIYIPPAIQYLFHHTSGLPSIRHLPEGSTGCFLFDGLGLFGWHHAGFNSLRRSKPYRLTRSKKRAATCRHPPSLLMMVSPLEDCPEVP